MIVYEKKLGAPLTKPNSR